LDLLRRVPRQKPDVLVLDAASFAGGAALECVRRLRLKLPDLPVIFVSARKSATEIKAGLRSGAQGYLVKPVPQSVLRDAIKRVARGGVALSPAALSALVASFPALGDTFSAAYRLSRREEQVLRHLQAEYRNKEIATALHISEGAVQSSAGMSAVRHLNMGKPRIDES